MLKTEFMATRLFVTMWALSAAAMPSQAKVGRDDNTKPVGAEPASRASLNSMAMKPDEKPAAKSEVKTDAASTQSKPEAKPTETKSAESKTEPKSDAGKEQETTADAPPAFLAELECAVEGLLFISETDAPLTPFFWASDAAQITPELVAQFAKLPENPKVSAKTLDEFFEPVAKEEEWMNAEEKAEAAKFQALAKLLKDNLKDITIYRVGETKITVFVAGKTQGGFAGVMTEVVET